MVQLAPHLVYPTPYLVPTLRRGRPRPRDRDRPEHVRRDGDLADRARPQPARRARGRGRLLVPGPPPHDRRRGGRRAGPRARPAASPSSAYLFYDCQTDDARLVLTILGEAERFGAVLLNGAEVTEILDEGGRAVGRRLHRGRVRRALRGAGRRTSSTRPASGPTASGPTRSSTEEEIPRIAPEPRHPHHALDRRPAGRRRRLRRPRGRGPHGDGPALVRAGADRHHRQRLRRRHRPRAPERRRRRLPARRRQRLPRTSTSTPRPRHRRLRWRAAADLDRRPEEVGGHLAQGRAVRDLVGDADHHRRQAHDLAADGGADRGPHRRARRPRRRVAAPTTSRSGCRRAPRTSRRASTCPRAPPTSSPSATGTPRAQVLDLAEADPELAGPILPGHPDLLAEVVIAARAEQARSVADVLLRRTRLGPGRRGRAARARRRCARSPRCSAAELGWSPREDRPELEAWRRW